MDVRSKEVGKVGKKKERKWIREKERRELQGSNIVMIITLRARERGRVCERALCL